MNFKKRILIASLNWGLGHATRCIPIIKALIKYQYEPIIVSDGDALKLLKIEFPDLEYIELPSYNITYPKNSINYKWHFFKMTPYLARTIWKEKRLINQIIKSHKIDGLINDSRFGVYSKEVPSVYITHQLNVLSGNTTWLSTKWHNLIINKFDECWVPDFENHLLSGIMSKQQCSKKSIRYIGPLSRLTKKQAKNKYDILLLLSGPEPQRSLLEAKLLQEFKLYNGSVILIRGVMSSKQIKSTQNNIRIYNYMNSSQLETVINESSLIISRSGYSSIMDLAKLGKKALFIPTQGQFEQEYLANHLEDKKLAPFCTQEHFELDKLEEIKNYSGFESTTFEELEKPLFSLFESK